MCQKAGKDLAHKDAMVVRPHRGHTLLRHEGGLLGKLLLTQVSLVAEEQAQFIAHYLAQKYAQIRHFCDYAKGFGDKRCYANKA
jgi:hypothetical protein